MKLLVRAPVLDGNAGPFPLAIFLLSLVNGCITDQHAMIDSGGPYKVVEGGKVKDLQLGLGSYTWWMPMPAGGTVAALVEPADDNERPAKLVRRLRTAPRHRTLSTGKPNLFHAIDAMTSDVPSDRPRWIVGTAPVTVAIGEERTVPKAVPAGATPFYGRIFLGGGQRLVSANDLEHRVTELRVLDHWPEDKKVAGGFRERMRRIELDRPLTLSDTLSEAATLTGGREMGWVREDGAGNNQMTQ